MKPGDKVVCIEARRQRSTTLETGLVEGAIYTVRTYGPYRHYVDGDFIGIRLMEIDRGADPAGFDEGDMPFHASRFRPLVKPAAPAVKIKETA